MDKSKQILSIMKDLEEKSLTLHQATELVMILHEDVKTPLPVKNEATAALSQYCTNMLRVSYKEAEYRMSVDNHAGGQKSMGKYFAYKDVVDLIKKM